MQKKANNSILDRIKGINKKKSSKTNKINDNEELEETENEELHIKLKNAKTEIKKKEIKPKEEEKKEEPKEEIKPKEEEKKEEEPKEEIKPKEEEKKEDLAKEDKSKPIINDIVIETKPNAFFHSSKSNINKSQQDIDITVDNPEVILESEDQFENETGIDIPIDIFNRIKKEEVKDQRNKEKQKKPNEKDNIVKIKMNEPNTSTEIHLDAINNEKEERLNLLEKTIIQRENILQQRENQLHTYKIQLDIEKRDLDTREENIHSQLESLRKEEEKLRGHTKIDKILILIKELKDDIIIKNIDEEKLIRKGLDLTTIDSLSRKMIRNFSDYEFYVKDAKFSQSRIITILKYLTLIMKNAENKITQIEYRAFYKIRGLLKAFHIRLNFFDNHIHSKENKPLELMRIFSALEPTCTWLSSLDEDGEVENLEYDKIVKSFGDLLLEEKISFFKTFFEDQYVDHLDNKLQSQCFIRILTKMILSPSQVLDQIAKWEKINPEYRKKFISFLATELVPTERVLIAQKDIAEMKDKGLI